MSGLASGIDTSQIITQLMQINQIPQNKLKLQQSAMQARATALTSLQTELENLRDKADAIRSQTLFTPTQSVDSSDPTKITATRSSGAGVGGTQVDVARLANSQQRTYSYTPSVSDTTLDFGGGDAITVTAGTSIDDLVTTINSATGLPVYAASITDPNNSSNKLLVLSSKTPGATGDFALAVQLRNAAPHLGSALNGGDIAQAHRNARCAHAQRDGPEIREGAQVSGGAYHELRFRELQYRTTGLLVSALYGLNDFAVSDPKRCKLLWIEHDLVLLDHAADAGDLGHVGQGLQLELEKPVL